MPANPISPFLYNRNNRPVNRTAGELDWNDPMPSVYAKEFRIGQDVTILSNIGSPEHPLEYLYIGDGAYIGEGCNIQIPKLVIGDFTKIHRNCLVYGRHPLRIGHNCWFGEGTIIDAEGSTTIGNNVGVGAHSQLWSHIRHGDIWKGCKYLNFGELTIEDDCWFVGSCIVSPIHAMERGVALVGSVVTRNMEANHVYGGSPAKDLTDKLGPPFGEPLSAPSRTLALKSKLVEFHMLRDMVESEIDLRNFNCRNQTYKKLGTVLERQFIRSLLPEIKFLPDSDPLKDIVL